MKVLIISHLPVATQNNMGKTFLSLFSEFERKELCQLYIYPAFPDVDRCASFYRVTDKDVLRALPFGSPGGEVDRSLIRENAGLYENPADESFYRNRKNKSALRRLLRDIMWRFSRWDNRQLDAWLEREQPDCIFVAPGVAKFLYEIAFQIQKKYSIPIVSYVCDEYYFVKEPEQWLDRIRLTLLKNKIETLLATSAHLIVISEELKEAYTQAFQVEATTLMTGTSYAISEQPSVAGDRREICYFGNIRCNRYISLSEVGRELDAINQKYGTDYKLKIYTSEKDREILSAFSGIHSVELCGFLTGEAYYQVFRKAQLLLHVEAFDEVSVDFVQHSVSTKIADCLASGIPLLAYGPEKISSMQHLLRNDCALMATSCDQLRDMLVQAFQDTEAVERVAQNGLAAAEKYHNSKRTSLQLRQLIKGLVR